MKNRCFTRSEHRRSLGKIEPSEPEMKVHETLQNVFKAVKTHGSQMHPEYSRRERPWEKQMEGAKSGKPGLTRRTKQSKPPSTRSWARRAAASMHHADAGANRPTSNYIYDRLYRPENHSSRDINNVHTNKETTRWR